MTFSMGTVYHTPATSAHRESLHPDTFWNDGILEQSEYNAGRGNLYPKDGMWDWENRVYRDVELVHPSRFSEEVESQQNEDVHVDLSSEITTSAFLPCSLAAPGDPACKDQISDEDRMPQRDGALDPVTEIFFGTNLNTHGIDLGKQELYGVVQSSNWNALSSLDHFREKRILNLIKNEKTVVDQIEIESLRGSEQVTNHHGLRSSGSQTLGFLGLGRKLLAVCSEKSEKIEGIEIKASTEDHTYFEDTTVFPAVKHKSRPLIPVKKQRGSSAAQAAYCQVEGCKLDLTTEKEYHRRHKVCAAHSKSPKVIVASLEQRFCQQCSRFHVLAEFDEGKRSCRRRLAGHNERRRKPQPDYFLLTSGATSPFQGSLTAVHITEDRYSLMQHPRKTFTNALCDTDGGHGYGKATWSKFGSNNRHPSGERFVPYLSPPAVDKLYMLLQPRKSPSIINQGVDGPQCQQSSGFLGHGLALSSSSGGLGVLHGTQVSPISTIDSESALSLLSSHVLNSKASSSSVSFDVSLTSDLTLEEMAPENQVGFAPQFSQRRSEFEQEMSQSLEQCFSTLPRSHENGIIYIG